MAGKYWWEEDKKQSSQQATTQSNIQTGKKYWWEEDAKQSSGKSFWWDTDGTTITTMANDITNKVNSWLQKHNSYISEYQKRYEGRKYNYEDAYVSDSADWLDQIKQRKSSFDTEADAILSYIDQYKGYLDQDWIEDVKYAITSAKGTQFGIIKAATADKEWWSNWENEDAYKADVAALNKYNEQVSLDTDAYAKEIEDFADFGDEALMINVWYNDYMAGREPADAHKLEVYNRFMNEYGGDFNAVKREYADREEYLEESKQVQAEAKEKQAYDQKLAFYSAFTKNEDFSSKSAYKSTYRGGEKFNALAGMYTDTGFDDITYDYINRDETARGRMMVNDIATNEAFLGLDTSYLQEMTEDEIAIYNYLYDSNDKTASDEYLAFLLSDLTYRQRQRKQEEWAEYAKEHPFLSSTFSVLTSPLKGLSAIGQFADYAADGTVDQNAGYNKFSYIPTTIRGQVASDIEKSGNWGKVGSWTYQLGMSMGDFLVNSAVSGGSSALSLALMGSGAMADTVISAKDRGLSDDQAMILGVVAGASEIVTEKFSLDALFKGDLSKGAMRYILTNAFTEGTEEVGSTLINTVADVLVSKDKSEWATAIKDYRAKNPDATESEAFQKVLGDNLLSLGLDFLGGALSGGVMGTGGATINYLTDARPGIKENIDAVNMYGGSTAELIQEGLASDPNSDSYDLAQHYQAAVSSAEKRLTELGESQNVSRIAELVAKRATGQKMTRAEISTLARSQYGAQVAKEMRQEVNGTKDFDTAYKSLEERVDNIYTTSESGQATVHDTNEAIDLSKLEVVDFVKDEKTGKVTDMVIKVDGKGVRASDIDFADDSQAYLFSAVQKIENITPGDAQVIIRDYDPASGQTVGEYLNGVDEAFTYGYYNYSEADLKAGNFTGKLTEVQAKSAYMLGQNAKNTSNAAKSDAIKLMRTAVMAEAEKAAKEGKEAPKSKKLTITYNHGGGVVETINTVKDLGELNDEQRGGFEAAELLHMMGLGTDFELFASKTVMDEDGNPMEVFINDEGQEEAAYAGVYLAADGKIRIDLNAYTGTNGLVLNALSHELVHFIKTWSLEKYTAMAEFLTNAYGESGMTMHQRVLREQARLKGIRGKEVSYGEAYDEVVANALNRMFDDGKVLEKLNELTAKDKGLVKKILEGIKRFFKQFMKVYQNNQSLFHDTEDLMKMKEVFEQLQNMFAEALVDASANFQAAQQVGFELDTQTESVAPAVAMKSENTWKQSDYVQERDKAAKEISKAIGVSEKKAKDYIDSINSIAKMIAEDRSRLDYFSSPGRSSFVDNAEYGGSFDFSTLCKKRRLLTGTFTAIQKALPNTALTADEILDIRNRMKEANLEVSCGLCYVEGSRANMGQFAKEFLRLYKQYYPDAWQPNMADVNTPDGIEWVRINHPECYEQYEYFWNHYGTLKDGDKNLFASQQKPKLYQLHTEYKGEILNKFKNDDKVEDKNLNGGIRLQSFSDFEIVHLIDTMQIIMDMSRVGLAGQAYTKVPDFAWALGDTGLKINLSLIAKGVDANGKLIFDDVEGMPIADAMKLRNRYSKNVGTILVAFNDEQLLAAMADDRVDFIIPFHRSQWKKSQYEAMGLPAKTKDYTFMQNEKYIKPQYHEYRGRMVKDKATNYMPNEYWDFSKSGKENAEAYLEMCARNNKRPKFYKLLQNNGDGSYSLKADGSTDGYWKLLIDFKMYDNEGNGSPQMAVKPDFNMEEANRMLNDYKGGHSNFPVAHGIVDSFVKDYKASRKGEQYSSQETDVDADKEKVYSYEGLPADAFYNEDYSYIYSYDFLTVQKDMTIVDSLPTLQELQTEGKIDSAKVLEAGYKNILEMGGTKVGNTYSIINTYTNRPLQIGKNSITHGLGAENINAKRTNARLAAVIGELCKNAIPICALPNTHNVRGTYGMAVLVNSRVNGKDMNMIALITVEQQNGNVQSVDFVDVAHAVSGRLVRDTEKENRSAQGTPPGTKSEWATRFSSTLKITQFLDIVNRTHQGYLSDDVISKLGEERRGPKKALFSTQQTDNITNRHLLAGAFEGITKSSPEYELIQEYKGRIKILNEYEEKLAKLNAEIRKITFGTEGKRDTQKLKQLQAEAKKVAENINRNDKKLLSLEASEPLRRVIERERKKEAQKTKEHVKEIQQNKKVRAEQTELRYKIRKAIRDLDKILNRGNKKQNVKEDLQPVVTKALQAAEALFTENYGNYDMLRNGIGANLSDAEEALVESCAKMLKDLDKMPTDGYENWQARQEAENRLRTRMSKLKEVFARERKRLNNTTVSSILGELADAYKSMENSEQSYVKGAYMEPVYEFLKSLQSEVGGTIVSDMTKTQLESVYAAYKMVLTTVRKANELFNQGLKMSREQLSNVVIEEVIKAGGNHGPWSRTGIKASQASWNNMKPVWVANRIGSESFGKLMQGLFEGQYNFAKDIEETKRFKLEMDKKYKPRSWDAEKQYEFESSTGKKFSLNLQQIMSLYAFSKREQAYSHLLNGGLVFDDNSTIIVDKHGIKRTYVYNDATTYKLNEATLNGIINTLTAEQKAYVDEMQAYLSDVMGAKGNEVSMQLYGIKMFKEKFYFPLRSSADFMERAEEAKLKQEQGQINLVNSGFTHAVKPEAKNPIILAGFMDVWAEHCNEMSMYHSMVLPMEDFRKVYNYSTVHDDKLDSASVKQAIKNAYGGAATAYINQLYRELNAGATVDPRETPYKKLISNFKKSAVMLSGSVVVQQFSSIGRAFAVIDPKYFAGAKVSSDTQLSTADEMKKYAPVAIIKEMGGFDTGTKGSAKSYIMAETYGKGERIKGFRKDEQYRGDIMGYLPAKADEKTWCTIWEAVKRETKAKNPKMDIKSEEFLKLAGERFSEVVEKTQVYDSVLARSANMRSKSNFMAMATAFMAEPTTTINLIEDAIRRGDKKYLARTFGAVAVSIVLNNALASIVYAMRDDDEDETSIEKYFQSFTSGLIDDINPMSYYPFLKDIYSLFQGYDVERTDMAVFADVRDALKKAVSLLGKDTSDMDDDKLAEHNKQVNEVFMSILDAGFSVFGVPVKNVRRDGAAIINGIKTIGEDLSGERSATWNSFWDKVGAAAKDTIPIYAWTKDQAKADKLYTAIISGDKAYLDRLKSTYKTEDAYQSAVCKALRENDSRIHAAAQAGYEGNSAERNRIYQEIKKEGKFAPNLIIDAINSELNAIRNKLEPDKVTGQYEAYDFVEAVSAGDASTANTVRGDIISTYVANGKTRSEAEKAFVSDVKSSIKEAYSYGALDKATAENILVDYADMDDEDAKDRVTYWDFCKENPNSDLSESRALKYLEFAEPANISLDVYKQFVDGTKDLSDIKDEWGDVEVSKREQVLGVIDSLPLTWQQKDALYLAAVYSEDKIWDVPW